jgi:DNA-binding IclR family transcriptional regulator
MFAAISPSQEPILNVLLNCHPDDQLSVVEIAEAAGYSERHTIRQVQALERTGYLSVVRGNGKGHKSRYQIAPQLYTLLRRVDK